MSQQPPNQHPVNPQQPQHGPGDAQGWENTTWDVAAWQSQQQSASQPSASRYPEQQPAQRPEPAPMTYAPAAMSPIASADEDDRPGFFRALFDFKFNRFVAPSVVKFLYSVFVILMILIWLLVSTFVLLNRHNLGLPSAVGIAGLVLGWIPMLISITFVRVMLEFMLASIRTSQDIRAIRRNTLG